MFIGGLIFIILPIMGRNRTKPKILAISHLWNVFEELTLSAFMMSGIVVAYYFSARTEDTFLSFFQLLFLSISTFFISYIIAVPFYLLVERPFKNFISLILFPARSIFSRKKDVEDDDSSDEGELHNDANAKTSN